MNFRPAPGKVHFVHIRFHQLDAVPVRTGRVRSAAVSQYFSEIESFHWSVTMIEIPLPGPQRQRIVNLFSGSS